jgi:hypothetical protein
MGRKEEKLSKHHRLLSYFLSVRKDQMFFQELKRRS